MRKFSIIIMALALVVGMAQCKKNEPANESVKITLKLTGSNSKVNITPNDAEGYATVDFTSGDFIYVGCNGKYVGTLTFQGTPATPVPPTPNSSVFTGTISGATEGQPLYFFFTGNKNANEPLTIGTTESCTIDMSDQSTNPIVVSCGISKQNYASSTTAYTCDLLRNQCAFVKFTMDQATNAAVTIAGVKNQVTVNFSGSISEGTVNTAINGITTYAAGSSASNVRYAVIPLGQGAVVDGAISATGYTGTYNLPAGLQANDYNTDGTMALTAQSVTINASVNPANTGTVSGAGTYNCGESCTLTATPAAGCTFLNWTKGGTVVSTTASYTFIVSAEMAGEYVANFNLPTTCTVTVSANPTAGGTVSGGGNYSGGASCTLTATANWGYHFVNWTKGGAVVSTSASYSFTVTELSAEYVANFAPYVFTVNGSGKKVAFSSGNLQYNANNGTYKWRFAEHQYDYLTTWNTASWIDHFGWGVWTGAASNPTNTSTNNGDYSWNSQDFIQEASLVDATQRTFNWYTLSRAEWMYIADHNRWGGAFVNNIPGNIILPDDSPPTFSYPGGTYTFSTAHSTYYDNNITNNAIWDAMEAKGAVFLPNAMLYESGSTNLSALYSWNNIPSGFYWMPDVQNWPYVWMLTTAEDGLSFPYFVGQASTRCTVRLVRYVN